jgi:hypothetical protein
MKMMSNFPERVLGIRKIVVLLQPFASLRTHQT